MLKHTSTKTELRNKQQSQEEQNHGQQYFLDVKPHTLFSDEIYLATAILSRKN